jgi:predicted AlkP superfamily pyrophosphatase or phosphodiesterase
MKRDRVAVFVFVDALGFNYLRSHEFLPEFEFRAGLRPVLGYSCACHPTLFSGRMPHDHGHGAMYALNEGDSPLEAARGWGRLPAGIADNYRVRSRLQARIGREVSGYFSLYEVPTRLLPRFDLVEPRNIFEPGAIRRGTTIFDEVAESGATSLVRDWRTPEVEALQEFEAVLGAGSIDWGLVYLPGLDGLLHSEGSGGEGVARHLDWYEGWVRRLKESAAKGAGEVHLYLFSDHGMSNVRRGLDVISPVERTFGRNGDRYLAFYDSTMVRVWADEPGLGDEMAGFLRGLPMGRLIEDPEKGELGVAFADRSQGDLCWVADEGVIVLPSYMGRSMLAGMHGYHPDAIDADACVLGSETPRREMKHIRDLHGLMQDELRWTQESDT